MGRVEVGSGDDGGVIEVDILAEIMEIVRR
jgi:hypothetical protein